MPCVRGVSHLVGEMTRDRYSLSGRLGTSNCESLFSSCFVGHCFHMSVLWLLFIKLQPFFQCWENFEELAFRRKLELFAQGYLCSSSKLLCRAVYDWFSFFHFEN